MRPRINAWGGIGLSAPRKLLALCLIFVALISTISAQASFNLIGPGVPDAPGPTVTDPSSVTLIQWQRLDGSVKYTFELTYPNGEVLTITDLTPGHNSDTLDCFTGNAICNFTVQGEAVLTQNGTYSWTVFAYNDQDDETEAANAPYYFTVASPDLPGAFDIIGPGSATAPGPEVTDPSAVTQIQWEESAGADTYTFELTFPDNSVVELASLNDGEELNCDSGTCTLTVAGETVLTQNGAYSWTVTAFNSNGSTEAANAPYFFTVNAADLPGAFDIIGPGSAASPGPEVTDPSAVTQIQWEESAGAETYTFELTFPDNSVVELANLNDGEELNCDAGTCTLTVAGETVLTQNGAYSWTVFAFNSDGSTEAANAPYFFTVNAADLPSAFNIIGPGSATAPGPEVTDPSAVTQIQWEESAGAETYTFELTFPDNSVVELANLNDGEELNCDSGTCTLTVAGETVLTQNGAYSWTVFAFNSDGSTEAANAPYFFTVNATNLPDAFSLIFPADGSFFSEALPVETPIEWGLSADAQSYRWVLQKVSTNTRLDIGTIVDAQNLNDGDELTCDEDSCVFVVDASVLDSGQYSWTVFATNEDGTVEAVNGPYTFTVDLSADDGIVVDGSFEGDSAWNVKGGNPIKCSTNKPISYNGNCALVLRGIGKASQSVDAALLTTGTSFSLSAWIEGKNARVGSTISLKVKFADGTKAKAKINAPTGTYNYQQLNDTVTISGQVTKAKLVIAKKNGGGRIRIDGISLMPIASNTLLPLPR